LAVQTIAVGLTTVDGYDVIGFSLHDGDHYSDLDVIGPDGFHYSRSGKYFATELALQGQYGDGWQLVTSYGQGGGWRYVGSGDFENAFSSYGLAGRGIVQSPDDRLFALPLDLTLSGAPSQYIELGSTPGFALKSVADLNRDGNA